MIEQVAVDFLAGVQLPTDRTLTDQVTRILRKGIILGDFPPGSRLVELQLADQLQVSRSTIREALRRLEGESLIEISPHRGTRVASVSASDALEICELHSLIESQVIRNLELPISDDVRASLLEIVSAMEELTFPGDVDQFIDLDRDFHHTLVQAANRPRFQQVWTSMNSLLGLLVTVLVLYLPLNARETAARHRAIVDAVSQSNRDIASVVISDHYRSMGVRTEEAILAQEAD